MSIRMETVSDVAAEIRNDIEQLDGLTEGLAKSYLKRMLDAHQRELDDGTHDYDGGYADGSMQYRNALWRILCAVTPVLGKFCRDYCDGSCLEEGRAPNYCKTDCEYKDLWAAVNQLETLTKGHAE